MSAIRKIGGTCMGGVGVWYENGGFVTSDSVEVVLLHEILKTLKELVPPPPLEKIK